MTAAARQSPEATVLWLAQLLQQQPASAPPCLVEPGLLPPQGILFGGWGAQGRQIPVGRQARPLAGGWLGPRRVFHPRSAPGPEGTPDLPVRTSPPAVWPL